MLLHMLYLCLEYVSVHVSEKISQNVLGNVSTHMLYNHILYNTLEVMAAKLSKTNTCNDVRGLTNKNGARKQSYLQSLVSGLKILKDTTVP